MNTFLILREEGIYSVYRRSAYHWWALNNPYIQSLDSIILLTVMGCSSRPIMGEDGLAGHHSSITGQTQIIIYIESLYLSHTLLSLMSASFLLLHLISVKLHDGHLQFKLVFLLFNPSNACGSHSSSSKKVFCSRNKERAECIFQSTQYHHGPNLIKFSKCIREDSQSQWPHNTSVWLFWSWTQMETRTLSWVDYTIPHTFSLSFQISALGHFLLVLSFSQPVQKQAFDANGFWKMWKLVFILWLSHCVCCVMD